MPKRTAEFRQTAREHSAEHTTTQRRKGLARISLWVPNEDAERLRDIAAQLRKDAGKPLPADGNPSPRSVEVPIVEPRYPDDARVWLKVDQDEFGLHMLLRSNGGEWRGQRNLWEVPASLPAKLGLRGRVVQEDMCLTPSRLEHPQKRWSLEELEADADRRPRRDITRRT